MGRPRARSERDAGAADMLRHAPTRAMWMDSRSVGRRRPGDPATPTQSRRSEAKECVMVKRAMSGVVGGAVVLMALGGC
ncbi:MAG: hypothetical protein AAGH71_07750, partial [Planctomycetota bacterium]